MPAFKPYLLSILMLLFWGCAHVPPPMTEKDVTKLIDFACQPGAKVRTVQGSVSLKAKSKEISGSLPASIKVTQDSLNLEVMNLLGGTEAVIVVQDRNYSIQVPNRKTGKNDVRQMGKDTWGGIPLRWATELFLGRVPCPNGARQNSANAVAGSSILPDGGLVVADSKTNETYTYHFKTVKGIPWPESLHWEQKGDKPLVVDFKFENPDPESFAPQKWDAKSAAGEIYVRWKERQVK